jgi:phosphatidylinositol alpha-1,6-mannosyltransferase
MFSVAKDLSSMGNEVFVFPDHWFTGVDSFKVKNVIAPKFFRHYIKKFLLSINGQEESVIICDTWKSVNAVPKIFKNIVVFAHGQEYLKLKNKKRILSSLLRTKLVITSSKYTYDLIKNNWNIPHLNLSVLYPTYHIKKLAFKKNSFNKVIKFISICRIEKRKGLFESLVSLKKIELKGHDFIWDIIGDGPQLDELKKKCIELNLEKKVFFHGRIKSNIIKNNFLKNSDIFLMPTLQDKYSIEGFGLTYIEAARFGIPSIAGISGGSSEAVINRKTGWCVDPNNNNQLISIIEKALVNIKERRQFGNNALKRFEEELNGEKAMQKLLNFINQILK